MIYFLTASGVPVIKIGRSEQPIKRLNSCSVWSPVPLQIAAVDARGDHLTEFEVLHRFKSFRSHGEWLFAVPAVVELVKETAATGSVPGGWYLPDGYDDRRNACDNIQGPRVYEIEAAYGLTVKDIRKIVGSPQLPADGLGLSLGHVPALAAYLTENGMIAGYHDLLAIRKRPRKLSAA